MFLRCQKSQKKIRAHKKTKSNKISMVGTITRETKSEGQRKAKSHTTRKNLEKRKKRRELVPLMVGSYRTHISSNVI
jgi:hypothetical protein